jgi:hypothetical protein
MSTYRSRRDLARRMAWLFADNGSSETADLELVLDPQEGAPAGVDQVVIPVHRCILVRLGA